MPFSRLYCPGNGQDLILTGCSVDVIVVDVHTYVVLSQRFQNPLANSAVAVAYTFGMLSGAAICGFEMVRQDGTKIEGAVKEKEEAKKEYQEAVIQGQTASLGEELTKDVFSISVGNILPSETVTINLRFMQPLIDDEKHDQVRFMFPRGYAQRYGQAPTANAAAASAAHQPFKMKLDIQQAGPIKSLACPSGHSIYFELGPPPSSEAFYFASVTLKEPFGFLTQDVLIVITAANLDVPRCFVESHPSPNHPTTAVGLTFVPRFSLSDIEGGMEYIFLVDRSGSMKGRNIKMVQEALVVLLRGLPTKDTSFNIVSFGTKSSKLWDRSKKYTQSSLDHATKHVDTMTADHGGTEIALALQTVFASLQKPLKKPVALLLLTDGAAWDVASCVKNVENAARDLPGDGTFIRVFTVGIGKGASTNTCDSIARAGKGFALYVSAGEAMTGKCSRLIRAARTPSVTDLRVLWPGSDKEKEAISAEEDFEIVEEEEATENPPQPISVNLFQPDADEATKDVGPPPKPNVTLPSPPGIQQAPIIIPSIFPGTRTNIFAILSDAVFPKASTFPTSIKVQGKVQTTGVLVELDVPVAKLSNSSFNPDEAPHPILHTLAAKALITDREDGNDAFPKQLTAKFEKDPELKSVYLEKEIIRLGTTYALTSRHTSFVAVDRVHANQKFPQVQLTLVSAYPDPFAPLPHWHGKNCRNVISPRSRVQLGDGKKRSVKLTSGSGDNRDRLLSRELTERPALPSVPPPRELPRNGSAPKARPSVPAPTSVGQRLQKRDAGQLDPGQRLAAIARLQQFDGSFKLTASLLQLLGTSVKTVSAVKGRLSSVGLVEDVGSTMLALMWLRQNTTDEALDMIDKAEQWIKDKLGDRLSLTEVTSKVSGLSLTH